ncbi:hypothetical protein CU098_000034 [Rhizopus stolonifer]|uniref:Uncharacterized protein n=1 Tax=Rhizopus stolonifer TaxID=4846 RepID=A0A367IK04_RHIST|nr:hypothetical protein CU098_000034 [Rhizopus stolonifer]
MVSTAPCQDNESTTESHSMDGSSQSTGTPMHSMEASNHVTSKPMDSQMAPSNDQKMSNEIKPCHVTMCDDAHDTKQVKTTNNDTSNMVPDAKQVKSTQEEPYDDNDKVSLDTEPKVVSDSGSSVNQIQNGLVNIAAGDHIGTKNVDLRHIISNIASPKTDSCDACASSDAGSQSKSVNQVQNGLINIAAGDHIGADNVSATKVVHNVL